MAIKNAILIAGPTASGKSALALEKARAHDAIIVNTDSMQVYDVLRVLTARPDDSELARAQHELYGHVHPADSYSVAAWLADATRIADQAGDRPLIFAGGTGLYFKALLGGLSSMPDIPDEIRTRWRYRLAEDGAARLHRHLWTIDSEAAQAIRPADGQRIVRALEVLEATGKPISFWQSQPGEPLVDEESAEKIRFLPDRTILENRIAKRFDLMLEYGAIDEVQNLMALKIDPAMPAMKAIGVRELSDHISGATTRDEAKEKVIIATRQYAKRQVTWFRHQLGTTWSNILG